MMPHRHARQWKLLAASLGGVAATTHALEPSDILVHQLGPVVLRPSVSLSETYNDNILYQSTTGTRDDFITSISPGLSLTLGRKPEISPWDDIQEEGRNYLAFNYRYDYNFYVNNDQYNYDQHTFNLGQRWSGERLSLQGNDAINISDSIMGGYYNPYAIGGQANISRTGYSDDYTLTYSFTERIEAYVRGTHRTTDYAKDVYLYDETMLRGTAGFSYKPFAKTTFFGETYYGQTTVTPNGVNSGWRPDLATVGGFAGARGSFTPRLSGSAKLGYEQRDFGDNLESYGAMVSSIALTYRFSDRLVGNLSYDRGSAASVQVGGSSYVTDTINLRFSHRLGASGRLIATAGGAFSLYTYDDIGAFTGREDHWWTADFGLTYLIRLWVRASLSYDYENFNTNVSQGLVDYDVNRVTLSIAIGY